jgi:hypothetical protein
VLLQASGVMGADLQVLNLTGCLTGAQPLAALQRQQERGFSGHSTSSCRLSSLQVRND